MKIIFVFLAMSLGFLSQDRVKWKVGLPAKMAVGQVVELKFEGKIDAKWYVYASELKVDGPMPTKLSLENSSDFEIVGKLESPHAKEKFDAVWEGKIQYFEKIATFSQKIKVLKPGTISGTLKGQACSNIDGMCMPFSVPFSEEIKF
jgi:Disulphide bond corrector protein DsbC